MALSSWLKPPAAKRSCIESSDSENEDEPEEETPCDDVTSDFTSDSSGTRCSSTRSRSKQSKCFNTEWLKGRKHWLKYEKDVGMFCLLCQKYNKCPFDRDTWNKTPCSRIRLQSIVNHEKTAAHRDSVKLESEAATTVSIASAINPCVPSDGIHQAFACLYFLVKQKIAHTTNFEPFLDFLEFLGLHVKSKIRVAKNATYTSRKSIQEMVSFLSQVIENKILKNLKESDHVAIMFDESTDCTVTEQLVIHCRYIEKDTGELQSQFLKVIDVLGPSESETSEGESDSQRVVSLSADAISARICSYLKDDVKLDMNKIRGIGTDGASTMMGCRNGVVAQLKRITPSAIGVHCAAHRLNLASSQAGESVPYIKKFNVIIRQLFDFYTNSAVRTAGLGAIQSFLQEKQSKLLEPCSTRWLSVERSVQRLKECFISVVLSLEREGSERSEAKAIGLSRLVAEYRFVCTMLLLCDTLPHVTHLSKCFQIEAVDYSIIPAMLSSTITSLEKLITTDGINLASLQTYLEGLEKANISIVKQHNLGEVYFLEQIRKPYLKQLIDNLKNRFEDKSIISAFDIFDPKKMPQKQIDHSMESQSTHSDTEEQDCDAFMTYGNNHVTNLSQQYKCDVCGTSEECLEEWGCFRQYMYDNYLKLKHRDVIKELCSNKTISSIFPNMSAFAQICRVVPIHTADVERTFSQLKLIKTRIRNRLAETTLDSLLRIAIEGPLPEDYPLSEAVELWARKKNRRLSNNK